MTFTNRVILPSNTPTLPNVRVHYQGHDAPQVFGDGKPYFDELPPTPQPDYTFDMVCELGSSASKAITQGKWDIGDLGHILLQQNLGTLTDFAKHIGLAPRTVESHTQLARFYPTDIRGHYELSHTFYKYAHQFSLNDLPTATKYLDAALNDTMSCAEFYRYLQSNKVSEVLLLRELLGESLRVLERATGMDRPEQWEDWQAYVERAKAVLGKE